MNKITLNDGEKDIKNITVLSLFRNCSNYLDIFIKTFTEMEQMYNVTFSYYFCENNSVDNTRDKLKNFAKNRKCKLLLLDLNKDYTTDNLAVNLERIHTLLTLRNKLKDTFAPFDSEWTMIVDSGIHFRPELLKDMFKYKPAINNVAMMTPYVVQIYTRELILTRPEFQPFREQILKSDPNINLINLDHFFDTYPTVTKESIMMYPFCPFKKCQLCAPVRSQIEYDLIEESEELADVNSTFGGLSLIDTKIFNNAFVKWDTICLNMTKHTCLCEHVIFCDRIRSISGKRIVVLQDVKNCYRTS